MHERCMHAACHQSAFNFDSYILSSINIPIKPILNYELVMVLARFRAQGCDASVTYRIDITPKCGNKCASSPTVFLVFFLVLTYC
jgi:hypothetical protein